MSFALFLGLISGLIASSTIGSFTVLISSLISSLIFWFLIILISEFIALFLEPTKQHSDSEDILISGIWEVSKVLTTIFCLLFVLVMTRARFIDPLIKLVLPSDITLGMLSATLCSLLFLSIMQGSVDYIRYFSLYIVLFFSGNIPWDYAQFLNYSVERILLQRSDRRYLFIHNLIQQFFVQEFINSEPSLNHIEAFLKRGEAWFIKEQYDAALKNFDRAIELDHTHQKTLILRGRTYRAMALYEEALQDFNCAIELDPKYAWAITSRGQTYQLMERYEEALSDCNRAIELDPKYIGAFAGRGETYRLMKRYEEALQDFNRAIELDPKYTWAIASRGQTYRLMERYEEALQDFNRAIELNPNRTYATVTIYGVA